MATRRTILTAAVELIIERGHGGASISQITARAGVLAGAVYFHFRSKEGIAHALLGLDLLEGMRPRRGPALQEWSDLALLLARRLDSDPTVRAAPYLAALADSQDGWTSPWPVWRATVARPLHSAAREGELQAHVQPGAVAELLISAWAGMSGHRPRHRAAVDAYVPQLLPARESRPGGRGPAGPAPRPAPWSGPGPAETAA
ncbi:TetR/AcrR family transcriptional regulator [Streptomyces sp. WAC 06725]|uniref:TetR/AcrR family transcriptional regulator n=1 Tax=Streptomyces sp. WAC 06725 TaxID=2203209 RepID=UPI00163CF9FA|nr:TetR/AcrR family transcriptional regulator [Streptomyces sp. WAC 06725]